MTQTGAAQMDDLDPVWTGSPVWSGRPIPAIDWKNALTRRCLIGLARFATGALVAPWLRSAGIEHNQTCRRGKYPGLGGAVMAFSGVTLAVAGLCLAAVPVFGT